MLRKMPTPPNLVAAFTRCSAMDVQQAMGDEDWLVIDGGNTHFWSEIAVNLAGYQGKKLGGILHPGTLAYSGWRLFRRFGKEYTPG